MFSDPLSSFEGSPERKEGDACSGWRDDQDTPDSEWERHEVDPERGCQEAIPSSPPVNGRADGLLEVVDQSTRDTDVVGRGERE